ncbi:MAG: GAF domain-containing protein [Candidatus Krumholzibacteria bacterium]|nr:GAF domain-containing protein [Candidatus Krumholzibacteria bacterium]
MSGKSIQIAILGGGEEELNVLSEFHRTPDVAIIGVYDRDPRAVALEIAEIIGIPAYSDDSFLNAFLKADYIIATGKRKLYEKEIALLKRERKRIVNPAEAVGQFSAAPPGKDDASAHSWPAHLEGALEYMNHITDRERLLKWLLEISIRAVGASSGSIMLYSAESRELYIGYANGLSSEVVDRTRQKLGEGIAGTVARTLTPLLITEIVNSPLYRDGREREDIASSISVALVHEGKLLGVLNVSTSASEKKLGNVDMETITLLASKIAPILEQHLLIDAHGIRESEFQIRNYLEGLFHKRLGFHEKFTLLTRFLAEELKADTVAIYTATDEGDWLILGGSDQQMPAGEQTPRIHCNKGSLARAYVGGEEILMTEVSHKAGFPLKIGDGAITSIYIPLVHNEPLGVMVIEFSNLNAQQTFFRLKDALRFQVAFFTYAQIREIRQSRKLESLEELSSLAPTFVALDDLSSKIRNMPALLSSLIKASMASLHYESPDRRESAYHQFPEDEKERRSRLEYDAEMLEMVKSKWEPICMSYLSADLKLFDKPPLHRSAIGYPLFKSGDASVVYVGYNKTPTTPLDSSIFGEHETVLLRKVADLVAPIFSKAEVKNREMESFTFDDLLRYNQKLMIERISEEIERAERYHHGFTITLFRINGLHTILDEDYQAALRLVNELSMGIRTQVRKTDFFSWTEPDLFIVLSVEGYQRMGYLENRIKEFIAAKFQEKGYGDASVYYPMNGYAVFPGTSASAADLINEAKAKIHA